MAAYQPAVAATSFLQKAHAPHLSKRSALSQRQQHQPRMSQGVTYADLQFVRTARLQNTPQPRQEGSGDEDLTYENIEAAKPPGPNARNTSKQHKEANKWFWRITWGLLGTSLFLLATTIGLGVQYRQVSQSLQEASEGFDAETRVLTRSLEAQEQRLLQRERRLEEAEAKLNRSQTALRESWRLGNSTRRQLHEQEQRLATVIQERQAVEEKLNATLAQVCTDGCPAEWLLYGGKCLFFSTQEKSWRESKTDCEERSAQLLISKPGVPEEIPRHLRANIYWIGLRTTQPEEESPLSCSPYSHGAYIYSQCETLNNGWWTPDYCCKKFQYICEKSARPGGPDPLPGCLA